MAGGKETGMSEWQPIETAPKDDIVSLGWPEEDKFPGKVAFGRFGGVAWPAHRGVRATHWMKLPDPPQAERRER